MHSPSELTEDLSSTYTLQMTLSNLPFPRSATAVADELQHLFDEGDVAGHFTVTDQVDGTFRIRFERETGADLEVIQFYAAGRLDQHNTEQWVCRQLQAELRESALYVPRSDVVNALVEQSANLAWAGSAKSLEQFDTALRTSQRAA